MTSKSRVFVLVDENTTYDLKAAEKHGALVHFLNGVRVSPFNTEQAMRIIVEKLEQHQFDAEHDLLALTGGTAMVVLGVTSALSLFPTVRILLFDARNSTYQERKLRRKL